MGFSQKKGRGVFCCLGRIPSLFFSFVLYLNNLLPLPYPPVQIMEAPPSAAEGGSGRGEINLNFCTRFR
jgi:hypothetical protein